MNGVSLRLRLALAGAAAVILALGAAGFALSLLFSDHVERRAAAEMQVQLDQVLAGLTVGSGGLALANAPADPRFARPYGGLYWQVEAGGQVLRSRSLWDGALDLPTGDRPDGEPRLYRLRTPDGGQALALERVVTLPAALGGREARAAVAMDRTEIAEARNAFVAELAPYLAALALALIGAQAAQLAYGLRPLKRIGARIAALRSGEAQRMGQTWPAEMLPLAAEIDALSAAREADIARARTRAGDLAHGLKTPLQALIGEAGRLREEGAAGHAAAIEEIARSMRAHVDRELARARSAAVVGQARADVAKTVAGIHAVLSRTPDGQRVRWTIAVPGGMIAAIDSADLAEALGALAENAARHARTAVTIEAVAEAGRIEIAVRDDGGGVPDGWLSDIARRGWRFDESPAGNGLGLTIAADVAATADGRLDLANGPDGLIATLCLEKAKRL